MIITATDIQKTLHDLLCEAAADRVFVLCDENTRRLCWPAIMSEATDSRLHASESTLITIPAGDNNKNLQTLETVWRALTEGGATRHSLLINIGGGVVTDIGGFAAATFKRGIQYINVPT